MRAVVVERFTKKVAPVDVVDRLPQEPHRFLLESGGGPSDISVWSFFGYRPFLVLQAWGTTVEVTDASGTVRRQTNPFDAVDEILQKYQVERVPGLPPFCGGLVGYFSYDAGRSLEDGGRSLERLPDTAVDDLGLPDAYLCAYDAVAAVNHVTGEITVLALPVPGREEEGLRTARELAACIQEAGERPGTVMQAYPEVAVQSNFAPEDYRKAVARAVEYVHAGDIFQVNLAQRFTADLPLSPWELYVRLRAVNPAPFAAFLDGGGFQVVSASPERFLLATPTPGGVRVETRPIKGTRRRGSNPAEDAANRRELEESPKDRAELYMIVDLERNDLGRVCQFGTVKVPDRRRIETYPTVFHTAATVEGTLRPDVSPGRLLKAAFPGGSITGAPKIRAMEIIEELEGLRRGVYCGSLGYLSFTGELDLNIVIRTMVCQDGKVYFHAGGGIVADSDPEAEYQETLDKAKALINALLGKEM
ncbi:MAG: aminodeoxychorismate synthase component I [Firmicutes bacterium]|nr:aminodeoxychorismate synthase component I [Bacillota bacterium]